jgi:hypothetical protein
LIKRNKGRSCTIPKHTIPSVEKIKKEVNMSYTPTTISEHIWNEGKIEDIIEGEIKGRLKVKLKYLNSSIYPPF